MHLSYSTMNQILQSTKTALRQLTEPRYFRTERGFQGRFYCALQQALDDNNLLESPRILEMEYQKSARHGLSQRPDIILHVPAEDSGAGVAEDNYAVWALKLRASASDAQEDFRKLDDMFSLLNYPLGIFVNIDATVHHRSIYTGQFPDRLFAVAVRLNDGKVKLSWSTPLKLARHGATQCR